ncbi:MAG: hypothetical protein KKB09_07220 [Nanoarchaeota archaeon]|nr:hypothetical protein [Nanoarchaeota archaeon]
MTKDALRKIKNTQGKKIYLLLLFESLSCKQISRALGSNRDVSVYLNSFERAGFIEYDVDRTLNHFEIFVNDHKGEAKKRFERKFKAERELAKTLKVGERLSVKEHFFKATLKPFFIMLDERSKSQLGETERARKIQLKRGDKEGFLEAKKQPFHILSEKEKEVLTLFWKEHEKISLPFLLKIVILPRDDSFTIFAFLHKYFSKLFEKKRKEGYEFNEEEQSVAYLIYFTKIDIIDIVVDNLVLQKLEDGFRKIPIYDGHVVVSNVFLSDE